MRCSSCGAERATEGRFCTNCGAPWPSVTAPAAANVGASAAAAPAPAVHPPAPQLAQPAPGDPGYVPAYMPAPQDPVAVAEPQIEPQAAPPEPELVPPPPSPVSAPAAAGAAPRQPARRPAVTRRKPTLVIAVIAAFILLLVAGYLAYRHYRNSTVPPASEQSDVSTGQGAGANTGDVVSTTSSSVSGATPSGAILTSGGYSFLVGWQQEKDGPERPLAPYRPGDTVFLHFDVTGYGTANGRVDVSLEMTALDPDGMPLLRPLRVPVTGNVGEHTNAPVTANFQVTLPAFVAGGIYTAQVKVHDNIAGQAVVFSPAFVVEGEAPIAPAGLEIRDIVLSTSEGGEALVPPVFRGGQQVCSRLKIFGAHFRGDRLNATIDYRILAPDGSVALDRTGASTFNEELVYHPAGFFINFHTEVTLPPNVPKGMYSEEYVVHDQVSGQTARQRVQFEIR